MLKQFQDISNGRRGVPCRTVGIGGSNDSVKEWSCVKTKERKEEGKER